jgi:hypothetical protein
MSPVQKCKFEVLSVRRFLGCLIISREKQEAIADSFVVSSFPWFLQLLLAGLMSCLSVRNVLVVLSLSSATRKRS